MFQIAISILLLLLSVGYSTEDLDLFDTDIDDIFSSVIGPVYNKKTPHPIYNKTLTDKNRMLKFRTLNISLLKLLDDETPKNPMLNLQGQSYAQAPQRTRNYAQHSLRTRNYAQTQKKYSTHRAPKRPSKSQVLEKEDTENIYNKLYKKPENKLELEQMLEQPIPTKPDFKQDMFNETTTRFNTLYAEFQKWVDDETPSMNISRRQLMTTRKIFRHYRQHPNKTVAYQISKYKLQKFAEKHGRYNYVDKGVINEETSLYFQDRRAIERTLALMAQFIYGAQYKFIYAQKLKERYSQMIRYKIGYSVAILENLKTQYNSGYMAMHGYRNLTKVGNSDSRDEERRLVLHEIMYMLKIYERQLRIRVEFNEVINYIRTLELERVRRELLRKAKIGQKDVI
ncbi:uncharacterized protein LOC134668604 [Cydia fagiglandana]|uniref:uncharacterized protein LOC134668604 n=1 Tax=Cydia fagiglandana TaxID=1458189 RepID=UPI002FEDF980